MSTWSDEAKERAGARRVYRLDEATACIPAILEEEGCNKPKAVMPKSKLRRLVVKCCKENRRVVGGIHIPTIENTEVREVDNSFVKNNWSEMTDRLAEDGTYIVWEGGKRGGVRLGTLEEYQEQQITIREIANGISDKHNVRATIINEAGGESPYISTQIGAGE